MQSETLRHSQRFSNRWCGQTGAGLDRRLRVTDVLGCQVSAAADVKPVCLTAPRSAGSLHNAAGDDVPLLCRTIARQSVLHGVGLIGGVKRAVSISQHRFLGQSCPHDGCCAGVVCLDGVHVGLQNPVLPEPGARTQCFIRQHGQADTSLIGKGARCTRCAQIQEIFEHLSRVMMAGPSATCKPSLSNAASMLVQDYRVEVSQIGCDPAKRVSDAWSQSGGNEGPPVDSLERTSHSFAASQLAASTCPA